MRTALIAAITLASTIGAQEETRAYTMEWNGDREANSRMQLEAG
jgi:hypothetical protein